MRVLLLALLVLGSGAAPPILAAPPIQRSKRFAASGLSAPLLSSNRKGKRVSLDDVEKLAQEVAEIKSQIQTQNDNMKELMQLVAEKSGARCRRGPARIAATLRKIRTLLGKPS